MHHSQPLPNSSTNSNTNTNPVPRSSKRNNKRPAFVPTSPEISPDGLGVAWAALEATEQAHERSLIDKYTRFQKVDLAVSRFSNNASTVEEWLNERVAQASVASLMTSLTAEGRAGECGATDDVTDGRGSRRRVWRH